MGSCTVEEVAEHTRLILGVLLVLVAVAKVLAIPIPAKVKTV